MNYQLVFDLSTDTDEVRRQLEKKISTLLDRAPLESEGDLRAAVNKQLNRTKSKRHRVTAVAVVAAAVSPTSSPHSVLGKNGVVGAATFYRKEKSWVHDPEYRETLEIMAALYRTWDDGEAVRKRNRDRDAWIETMHNLAVEGADLIQQMIAAGLYDQEVTREEDGTQVIVLKPKFGVRDIFAAMGPVDKLGRMALDLHTDKTKQEISGTDDKPIEVEAVEVSILTKLGNLGNKLRDQAEKGNGEEGKDEAD